MNIKKAFLFFSLLISFSSFAQSLSEGLDAASKGNHKKAFEIFYGLSEKGDVKAMAALAYAYQAGLGIGKSEKQSALWAEKSAKAGVPQGEFLWGSILVLGSATPKNVPEGIRYLNSASQKGEAKASFALARIFYSGKDVDKNYVKALEYAKKSAAAGEGLAFFMIGDMYENGKGVDKNIDEAIKFYRSSLERIKPSQTVTSSSSGRSKPWKDIIEEKLKNLEALANLPADSLKKQLSTDNLNNKKSELLTIPKPDVKIFQFEKLSGDYTGFDGDVIQIAIHLSRPLPPGGEISIFIKDTKFLIGRVTNLSHFDLVRFTKRFRLLRGEELTFNVTYPNADYSYSFKPRVDKDFTLNPVASFAPKVSSNKAESDIATKLFGASRGDCTFLVAGVSMTGEQVIKFLEIPQYDKSFKNKELIKVELTSRSSSSVMVSLGTEPSSARCELRVRQ